MPKKTLKVQKVSVKDGRVSMQNEDNNWYTYFGDELKGKIWAGGKIKVSYEKSKNGKYTNRTIKKFKVIDPGKKPKGGSEGSGGGSGFKVSYSNTKEGFDARQDSITRQKALGEAVNLVAGKEKKATAKAILKDAEEFYNWMVKTRAKAKDEDEDEEKDDDDLDDDDSDEDSDDSDDDEDDDSDDDDDDDDDFDDLDDDDED